jgi:hypothetical protein
MNCDLAKAGSSFYQALSGLRVEICVHLRGMCYLVGVDSLSGQLFESTGQQTTFLKVHELLLAEVLACGKAFRGFWQVTLGNSGKPRIPQKELQRTFRKL